MSYLERDTQLIEELRGNLTFRRGAVVGCNTRVRFTEIGSYQSSFLGSRVYLGLKEYYGTMRDPLRLAQRISQELAIMQHIAIKLPHLLSELPLCYVRLLDKNSQISGIIMEDLSRGGQSKVRRMSPPPEVGNIFIKGSIDSDSLENMAVLVDRERRLMDFYPLFNPGKEIVNRRRLHQARIEKDMNRYTLQVDYDF